MSGTLDPKFDESFQMAVKDPEDVVYFRVFDCNMMKDKLMGTACLSTAEFVSGTETERKLQIVGTNYKKPDAGCLRVRVTAAFNGALANLTHEVDRMSRENDKFAENNKRLEGAINELEGEVDRMAGENARFEASNVKLEENVNRMEAENDRFAKNNEALEAQVSQLGEENEQFAENNEKLEAQVTAMTVENEKFSENNAKLAGQVEAMAAENEALAKNNETMARENEKLAASTAELQAQVGALSGENAKFFEGAKLVSVIVKRLEARATVVGYYADIPSLFLAYEDLVAGSSDADARWAEVFEFLRASANATMKTTKKPLLAIHQTRPILSEVDNAAAVRDTMRSVCSPEVSFGGGCEEVLAGAVAARDDATPDKAMRPLLKRYAAANAALAAAAANATSSPGSWPSPTRRSRRSIVR